MNQSIPDQLISEHEPLLIAHALGKIDGMTYTNSEAAFRNSVSHGFRVLEADLNLTRDGKAVLFHHKKPETPSEADWRNKKTYQLTWGDLSSRKYDGKYPVLDLQGLLKLLEEFPDLNIVLDIKSKRKQKVLFAKTTDEISYLNAFIVKRLNKRRYMASHLKNRLFKLFGWSDSLYLHPHDKIIREIIDTNSDARFLDRMIPQVNAHSVELVTGLYDFPVKIWTLSGETPEQAFLQAKQNGCLYLSISASSFHEHFYQLGKRYEIKILVYGTNDQATISQLRNKGVAGFFVDDVY